MKFDRHIPNPHRSGISCVWRGIFLFLLAITPTVIPAQSPGIVPAVLERSEPNAQLLAQRTIERLTMGDAFDAKLRQRIWISGRDIVGVGHYEQSGRGTGRYSLEMTIHDGDTKQTMKQISDGKLAWHRAQIGGAVTLRRVDLGRIDEFEREQMAAQSTVAASTSPYQPVSYIAAPSTDQLPSRLLVGGLVELIDRISVDYVLKLKKGTVERQPVWFLQGRLRDEVRARIEAESGRGDWAPLCPVEVKVAISATADATGFGAGLPLQIEFYSAPATRLQAKAHQTTARQETLVAQPVSASSDEDGASSPKPSPVVEGIPAGRIISLLEIYAMRKIEASPEERFRFISDDREATFTNDTRRYLDRISPSLTP